MTDVKSSTSISASVNPDNTFRKCSHVFSDHSASSKQFYNPDSRRLRPTCKTLGKLSIIQILDKFLVRSLVFNHI